MDVGSLAVGTLLHPLVVIAAALTVIALLSGVVARVAEGLEDRRHVPARGWSDDLGWSRDRTPISELTAGARRNPAIGSVTGRLDASAQRAVTNSMTPNATT